MEVEPIIRIIRDDEVETAIACIHSASARNKQDYPTEFIDMLNTTGYTIDWLASSIKKRNFFVTILDNTVVGTGSCNDDKIVNIFVDENYQGHGLGKKMMKYLEEILRSKGYDEVNLNANLSSVSFYQHLGYEIIEEVEEEIQEWKIKSFKMRKIL